MQNVRIVAAKLVREADSDRDLTPMGQNYPSLSYAIVGDLPAGAIKAEEGRMETAITDAGANLVPDDDWQRRISFPKLTNDKRSAFFDIELRLGDGPVEGFKEIRGQVSIFASSGTEDVDLGFKKLEAGAAGKEHGATIERYDVQDEQRATLDIKLLVSMERIAGITLVTAKGEEIPVSQQGYSSSGDECTLTYVVEGVVPKKFKLIARMAKDLHRLEVPFEIRDVDLLGRPRGSA
jgi:hypothetical protein